MVPELARELAIPVTQLRGGRYAPKGWRANPDALRGDGSAAESGVTWLGPTTPAYALCPAVDMRKGFDGLYGLPTQTLGRDVLRGDLFLFAGRDCLRAKPLYFDGTSLCLLHKRLSKGRFAAPCRDAQRTVPETRSRRDYFIAHTWIAPSFQFCWIRYWREPRVILYFEPFAAVLFVP